MKKTFLGLIALVAILVFSSCEKQECEVEKLDVADIVVLTPSGEIQVFTVGGEGWEFYPSNSSLKFITDTSVTDDEFVGELVGELAETFTYSANGYFYKVNNGDVYCGNGISISSDYIQVSE